MIQALSSGSGQMTLHEEAQMDSEDRVLAVRNSLDVMNTGGHKEAVAQTEEQRGVSERQVCV